MVDYTVLCSEAKSEHIFNTVLQRCIKKNMKRKGSSLTSFPRFLEHFILNGPDPKALDAVLNQLNDPNRKQPQDLDKAVIGT